MQNCMSLKFIAYAILLLYFLCITALCNFIPFYLWGSCYLSLGGFLKEVNGRTIHVTRPGVYACNLSTKQSEAGGSRLQGQARLHSEFQVNLFPKNQTKPKEPIMSSMAYDFFPLSSIYQAIRENRQERKINLVCSSFFPFPVHFFQSNILSPGDQRKVITCYCLLMLGKGRGTPYLHAVKILQLVF